MKIADLLNEGELVAFPTHKTARHDELMSRLAKASSKYDDSGSRINSYLIADENNTAYAEFPTWEKAEKAMPEIMMRTGRRDLHIVEL